MNKKASSVASNKPLIAKVPSFREFQSIRAIESITGAHALCYLHPKEIQDLLFAPVSDVWNASTLHQRATSGWDRQLQQNEVLLSQASLFVPAIVSGRENWNIDGPRLRITGQACIIDGAKRLDAMLKQSQEQQLNEVPLLVLVGLEEEEELAFRKSIVHWQGVRNETRPLQKVETNTLRLMLDTNWTELILESDPYVVKTGLGYTAAINVRRTNGTLEHILCGAKSLSVELEELRRQHQSLIGLKVRICKESDDQRAPYLVRYVGHH